MPVCSRMGVVFQESDAELAIASHDGPRIDNFTVLHYCDFLVQRCCGTDVGWDREQFVPGFEAVSVFAFEHEVLLILQHGLRIR